MQTDQVETIETTTASIGIPKANLLLCVCRNAAAHLSGRNLISVGRLVVASTIARAYGATTFGQYSLMIAMLAIAEWLLDFGTSDVFVREICRAPEEGRRLLRTLAAMKVFQIALACAGFLLLVWAMGYPPQVVRAGFFATGSLVCFGGVLIYHTLFKATLTIEREVAAELVSVLAMIALVRIAAGRGGTVVVIFACHMASRAIFLLLCYAFGKSRFSMSLKGVTWPDVRSGFHSSAAIGAIGLVVVVYESMDLLLLGRLGSLSDVGFYSGAQRFIAPIVVALTGIGSTLYPVAASYWPAEKADFDRSCQRAIEMAFVAAGLAICALLAGSDFLMRLLGPNLASGATILRLLAIGLFLKTITNTFGPVLYVVRAQNSALRLVLSALVVKAALIALLVPRLGYVGVACAAILTDCCTAAVTLHLVRRSSGLRVGWKIPLKVTAITIAAALAPRVAMPAASVLAPLIASVIFVGLAFLSGAVRLSEAMALLRWKTS